MSDRLLAAFIPTQIMMAVGEVYVGFVEDGCPLEWRSFISPWMSENDYEDGDESEDEWGVGMGKGKGEIP
jgi:hypothetical protein